MAGPMNKSDLTRLYNSPVEKVEHVHRSMGSSGSKSIPFVDHHGVRVTTAAGEQYLVHKGPEFGKSSQTVVVDAGHMSSNWKVSEARPVAGHSVSDFVKAGGTDYKLMSDNCIHGANRMTNLGTK